MKPQNAEALDSSRLVGFSDGVFAVAITLLVLDIQVPSENISLHDLVAREGPSYAVFVLSFMMVGIKWLNHHRMFARIPRVDTTLNVLNLLLLLGICVVPFTAALMAKYAPTSEAALASVIFGVIWIVNGALYVAIVVYAGRAGLAQAYQASRRTISLYAFGPVAYAVAIAVSFWNIYAGIALYLAVVSLYVFPE